MVREYKGSHSGEHGDGIVRSEFHQRCSAPASSMTSGRSSTASIRPCAQSGKIVDAPKMDDRSLFRYPPGYRVGELKTAWTGRPIRRRRGFQGAVEMCTTTPRVTSFSSRWRRYRHIPARDDVAGAVVVAHLDRALKPPPAPG